VKNLSQPVPQTITPAGLRSAYTLFFGNDIGTGTIVNTSSTFAEYILMVAYQFSDQTPKVSYHTSLSALLAIPLIVFQQNGENPKWNGTLLPPEYHVQIDLSNNYVLAVIPKWTVLLYTITSIVIVLWCAAGMFVAMLVQSPPTSSFDLVDFTSRVLASRGDSSLSNTLATLSNGNNGAIRRTLQNQALLVRDVRLDSDEAGQGTGADTQIGKIGFVFKGNGTARLSGGRLYE
jgi:hypothetical protein